MALASCRECGKEVSTEAAACPHCGAPLRRAGTSPWTVIGWVIVSLIGFWLVSGFVQGYRDGLRAATASPSRPSEIVSTPQPVCQVGDVIVRDIKGRNERLATYIVGQIDNRCGQPVGAQIKFTIYDQSGSVLSSRDLWPASTNNIPAHGNFPFEVQLDRQPGAAKFDALVMEVRHWD